MSNKNDLDFYRLIGIQSLEEFPFNHRLLKSEDYIGNSIKVKFVDSSLYNTKLYSVRSFYRPISKIVNYHL